MYKDKKVNFSLEEAMKVQRGCRGITPLVLEQESG